MRFHTKIFLSVMLCVLSTLLLANVNVLAEEMPEPVAGGTLIYAIPGTPDTLDPQMTSGTLTFQYVKSVYDTLVEADEHGSIVPALAESWTFSPQDLTLSFQLRRGISFHNGDAFTAADVKATFDRLLAEDSASPHQARFSSVEAIDILDEYSVQFVLNKIYVPLISNMGAGASSILPKRAIEEGHDFSTHPIGTGPFAFKEWVRDDHISYTKFADYRVEGKPYLDELELKVVVEPTTQLMGLTVGEFDIIHFVEPHTLPKFESNPDIKLFTHQTALALVVTMNHARPPLDNLLVRRAINHAIDRQTLLDIAYNGGRKIEAFIDSGSPYFLDLPETYSYDPQKAKELLAEAGHIDGFDVTITLPQNYTPHVNAGNMVQNMLQQVGIRAKIELVDWPTWISRVYRGKDYDLTVIGHTGHLDPDGRLGGEFSYTNYQNPEMFELIEKAATTLIPKQRKMLYEEIQRMMADDAMMVFTGTPQGLRGMRSGVYGFRMTYALDTPDFRDTFKTE